MILLDNGFDVKIGQSFKKEDNFYDDCFECKSFSYFYVYKHSDSLVEGSMYNLVTLNGKTIKHSDLYKLFVRKAKLERIING